jgi:hypothetical protein
MQYKFGNDINVLFSEYLNILPYFQLWYSNIMDILYYGVKEMHFTAHDLLWDLNYYEVNYLITKYSDEVKEKNKQQEEEEKRTNEMIADIKRGQQMNQNNTSKNSMPNVSMPSIPKI